MNVKAWSSEENERARESEERAMTNEDNEEYAKIIALLCFQEIGLIDKMISYHYFDIRFLIYFPRCVCILRVSLIWQEKIRSIYATPWASH